MIDYGAISVGSQRRAQKTSPNYGHKMNVVGIWLLLLSSVSHAFVPLCHRGTQRTQQSVGSLQVGDALDEVNARLSKARALLEKSRRKLASANQPGSRTTGTNVASSSSPLPFFAVRVAPSADLKREEVIKTRDDKTGLITTDGEKMALLSEEEEWEVRGLLEVFQNEVEVTSRRLANRDVAASIFNLRRTLQTEDYRKIFDTKNRFIGEDN